MISPPDREASADQILPAAVIGLHLRADAALRLR
jgi:hypothetical protein